MTATTTIERHHHVLLELLAPGGAAGRLEERIVAILDAAMAELAVEAVALRALAAHALEEVRDHFQAHARARLALFRMATSPSDSSAIDQAMRDLGEAFVDRPRALVALLGKHLDPDALALLGAEMEAVATAGADGPRRTTPSDAELR